MRAFSKKPAQPRMADHSFDVQWRFVVPPQNVRRVVISQRRDGPFRSNAPGAPGHYHVSAEAYGPDGWVHVRGSATGAYANYGLAYEAAERAWNDLRSPDPLDDASAAAGGRFTL